MSEEMGNNADVAVSLEDLFLSREFGQVNEPAPSTPRLSPFGPIRASTANGRPVRSRAYGTLSAAAAVVLVVAVGLSGAHLTPSHSNGVTSALSASPSNGHLNRGGATGGLPAATGRGATAVPSTGAGGSIATSSATQAAALTSTGGARPTGSGGTGTSTPPAANPAPTPPSQSPVAPVITLIDTTVSTATSTATGVTATTSAPTASTSSGSTAPTPGKADTSKANPPKANPPKANPPKPTSPKPTPPKPTPPKPTHAAPPVPAAHPVVHTAHVAAPTNAHSGVHLVAAGSRTHAAGPAPTW